MPSATPLALSHLSPTDRALFYQHGLGHSRHVPIPIIHHSFQKHALAQPDAIAVEHKTSVENASISYGALDRQSDILAHTLRSYHVGPQKRVCILAKRSISLVVGILAVLKSGGQYVPLDAVTIATETLGFVLDDAEPTVVLVMEEFLPKMAECGSGAKFSTLCLEKSILDGEELWSFEEAVPKVEDLSSPADGAYCIYTSGTTGQPKGVNVKHQGVANVISGPPGSLTIGPSTRVAHLLNIAFDMGAWETLGCLYNGGTLCLRGNTSKEWRSLMKEVDVVIATPSILSVHDPKEYPRIKCVIVGGEPCPQALADKWGAHTSFFNCCGPTEISICNTITPAPHTPGYPLSIGRPIPNTNVYILSSSHNSTDDASTPQAVPIGHVGCMWVGGIGADTSYVNLPEKNRERWRIDPFVGVGGNDVREKGRPPMMFNTGDLGRWRKDGQLEHMGRADDQVKVKGFRVELDGVSAAMRTYPPVLNAVTLLAPSPLSPSSSLPELWGFITPSTVDLVAVREAVAKIQPSYAVPKLENFMALEEFPVTRNGKVDKRALVSLVEIRKQAGLSASMTAPELSTLGWMTSASSIEKQLLNVVMVEDRDRARNSKGMGTPNERISLDVVRVES